MYTHVLIEAIALTYYIVYIVLSTALSSLQMLLCYAQTIITYSKNIHKGFWDQTLGAGFSMQSLRGA